MDPIEFLFTYGPYIGLGTFFAFVLYKKFVPIRLLPTLRSGANQPLLNAYYTNGKNLEPLDKGMFGALKYVLYITAITTRKHFDRGGREFTSVTSNDATIICCVTLPFKSACHLIGITKNGSATLELQSFIVKKGLEEVSLEGDFPGYAKLYSPPGNQINSRYLMDPSAMAYVADFCKTHHWEIVGNYLYFVSSDAIQGKAVKDDQTPIMTEDIERFVEEIKPAVGVAQSHKNS